MRKWICVFSTNLPAPTPLQPTVLLRKHGLLIMVHIAALLPLVLLISDTLQGRLGFNPIQAATFRSGRMAILFLLLSLAITPLNTITGWRTIIPFRKWLGIYAFVYVCVHFFIFLVLDYVLNPGLIVQAIFEKPYALAGFFAFLLLLPLALTSNRQAMRRLGKNWKRLHRLVYVAMLLGVVHFAWAQKADIREPLIYGAIVVVLLVLRLPPVRHAIIRTRQRYTRPPHKEQPT